MARNAVKRGDAVAGEDKGVPDEAVKPQVPGGALGVVPERRGVTVAGALPNLVGAARTSTEERPEVPGPRRWRVKWAPPSGVMYDNFRVQMRPGKVVTDQTYNIPLLERQGVQLEEIHEPKPVVASLPEPPPEDAPTPTAAE